MSISTNMDDISGEIQIRSIRPTAITWNELQEASTEDDTLTQIKEALETGDWSSVQDPYYEIMKHEFSVFEGVILRQDKIVIPTSLIRRVVELSHEGHPGAKSMKMRLRSKVFFKTLSEEVDRFAKGCKECIMTSLPDPPNPISHHQHPEGPWEHLYIDYKTGLPKDHKLFAVVCGFSKFIEYEIMKEATTSNTIAALRKMFTRWGIPRLIHADNGAQFVSTEFRQFCREYGIEFNTGPPYWPRANGPVERINREFGQAIKKAKAGNRDWQVAIADWVQFHHNKEHPATKETPSQLMIGRTLREKIPAIERPPGIIPAKDQNLIYKKMSKQYADAKRHAQWSDLRPGDTVLLRNHDKTSKLDPNFGPDEYEVIKRNGTEVIVENRDLGKTFRRVTNDCKKIQNDNDNMMIETPDTEPQQSEDENDAPEVNERPETTMEEMDETPETVQLTRARSTRQVKRPARYAQDYVMN